MILGFGPFHLHPERRELMRDGERVAITAKLFDTLVVLIENRGRVLEKEELLKRLWPDSIIEEATLVQTISMLRKVIGCSRGEGQPRYIATIPGRGYQFVGVVELLETTAPASAITPSLAGAAGGGGPVTTRPIVRRGPILLLVLVGTALTAGWLLRSNASGTARLSESSRPEPFTTLPGQEIFPTFSPEGDRIAFIWRGPSRDNWDVYVKLIGHDTVQRLTHHPAVDWSPAWSPDGKQIAFVRRDFQSRSNELMVIPAIGGTPRSILKGRLLETVSAWNQLVRLVTWHPDSEHVIVSHSSEPGQPFFLYAVSVTTGRKIQLTDSPARIDGDMDPAVSADARYLAYRRKIAGWNSDVYTVGLTAAMEPSGRPKLIGPRMFAPVWSLDGREIYMVDSPTIPSLWRVSPDGSSRSRVAEPAEAAFPAISPAGNRSAFSVIQVKGDIWQARLDGGGDPSPKPLITSTYLDLVPDFSPDGRRIAFASWRSGHEEVWVADSDGSNALQLSHHAPDDADCPAWSPDGREIAYHANVDNFRDVFVVDASGGTPRRLTHREGMDVAPTWSRDGRWIYFTSKRSGRQGIWKIPREGGEPVFVTHGQHAQESLNGKTIFVDDGSALWSMPVSGGDSTHWLKRTWANANFEVREQGIYFLNSDALHFLNFQTKAVTRVLTTPGRASWGLAVSPDNKTVLFAVSDAAEADIMLVKQFR